MKGKCMAANSWAGTCVNIISETVFYLLFFQLTKSENKSCKKPREAFVTFLTGCSQRVSAKAATL